MAEGSISTASTTINFESIKKWQPARAPSKSFEMGDIDGDGVVETSGASLLKHKITVELKTDDTFPTSGKSALDKWNDLDDLIKDENDVEQTLTIVFHYDGGDQTITFVGKAAKGYSAGFDEGAPDYFTFSLSFSTETKGAIV